jgi:hypothetical protein
MNNYYLYSPKTYSMKRFAFSFILLSGLLFTLSQCGSADAGTKFADNFFSKLIKGDFDKAAKMVELPVGDPSNLIEQLKSMANNPVNGQLKGFKKSMGFSTNISNGVTRVELPYVLSYEKGTQAFTVIMEDRGRGNKIISIN